ncbi:MAG: DUF1501 domain-containing protein [Planctomycetota bacterium]|nr:DUF1501 domain-containing protein [Planctomycetota bacterium]
MLSPFCQTPHHAGHAFGSLNGRSREGLTFVDRRGMLKAGLAGMAGLSLPDLLAERARAAGEGRPMGSRKSVILLWMAGGPSHIDTWDPKPERPFMNRGPFGVTQTKLPGVQICEHLPKQAAMLDKFTIIRSVDPRFSNHEPNTVMQSANNAAEPRSNPEAEQYPAIGSIVSKLRGANHPAMPAYVAFQKSRSHLAYAGYLGKQYDPFLANQAARLPVYDLVGKDTGKSSGGEIFHLPGSLSLERVHNRRSLVETFDRMRSDLDQTGTMQAMGTYSRQAVEMVLGRQAQNAFDIEQESTATRERYGKHLWLQQALLARRLVESGVSFVTLDLSYHTASGTWDTHGDNIPPYGGIKNGLGPLLPLFDHLITTLVGDLNERGLLDEVLVIAMGEFGRTPQMGTQDSTDGRNHWPAIMSMCLAGGGMKHGQVIGASEADGGNIKERPVTPQDLAATIYRHMEVPLDAAYLDHRGRPRPIVDNNGQPVRELF